MAIFEITIEDPHTGEVARLTSRDSFTLQQKADKKFEIWGRRAEKEAIRQEKEDSIHEANSRTEEAREKMDILNSILAHSLDLDHTVDWEALKDFESYERFSASVSPPSRDEAFSQVPKKTIWEFVFRFLKSKRLKIEQAAERAYEKSKAEYEKMFTVEKQEYEKANSKYENDQTAFNDSIDSLQREFESGESEAIERFVEIVLDSSDYPEFLDLPFETSYVADKRSLIVDMTVPHPNDVPTSIEFKYVATKSEIVEKEMTKATFKEFFENIISQISIRTIHEVLKAVYNDSVDIVIFNGWVDGIDPRTGNDFRNCIVSIQAERDNFESLNLALVSPRECIKGLKGIVASEFINIAPVKPVLHLNREDRRIVDSNDIIDEFDESSNLATMDWQKFEQLVRDLFEKEFSGDGVEVKITQASRDAGVDAIVFDPDPVRGGKFVIQAKRYNNVVGVSAVRDLFGTVHAEGAIKGILVTTSNYGKDSIEFVKDKPLTLINGSELIHMFNRHGYDMKIRLEKGRSKSTDPY